jgi:hypothetical protein
MSEFTGNFATFQAASPLIGGKKRRDSKAFRVKFPRQITGNSNTSNSESATQDQGFQARLTVTPAAPPASANPADSQQLQWCRLGAFLICT